LVAVSEAVWVSGGSLALTSFAGWYTTIPH
jgi:hypothetical protein